MRKILIANDLLKGGGVENVLENLVRYLSARGDVVWLLIPDTTEAEVQAHLGTHVKLYRPIRTLKKCKKYSLGWFWDRGLYVLDKFWFPIRFRRQKFDVAIALKEGPTMQLVSKLHVCKKFAWIHTDYRHMHWTKYAFSSCQEEKQCMMTFDKVACVSKAALESVVQTIGDPGNLCVRYNPIDWRAIRKKATEPIEERKNTQGPLFVSVGRLAYPKNYELLIDVCNELAARYDFELWIVGNGPDFEKLQQKIKEYGLTCVKLLGEKKNPFPYVRQADVFISTSLVESYGLAVQEALILGKPVVAVKCPAIEETLDPDFGLLVEGSHTHLKNALEAVLSGTADNEGFKRSIQKEYKVDSLFEQRMKDIVNLWE